MAKLTNVVHQIDETLVVTAGDPVYLEHLAQRSDEAARCDDSFGIVDVVVPTQDHQPDEMLYLWVGNGLEFASPIELLVATYRVWSTRQAPAELQECIGAIARDVAAVWARARTAPDPGDLAKLVMRTEVLTNLMGSFTAAVGRMLPGHRVSRAILVAPRMSIRVETSHGSPLKVYLRGRRGMKTS